MALRSRNSVAGGRPAQQDHHMLIEPLDVTNNQAVAQNAQLREACRARDRPDFPQLAAEVYTATMANPQPHSRVEHWVARLADGTMAGFCDLVVPQSENRDIVHSHGCVHPQYRRTGIGTALYQHVKQRAVALGRNKIIIGVAEPTPGGCADTNDAGTAFVERMGMDRGQLEYRSRLDIATMDSDRWHSLHSEAKSHATEYETVTWWDRADDSVARDMAMLENHLENDIPNGELEPAEYDVARWRELEDMDAKRLRTVYYAAARHKPTGTLVAYTGFLLPKHPRTHAWQITTVVAPEHRGRRLGLLVKLANIQHAKSLEPELSFVDTTNADSNAHMIAVNDALGFVSCDVHVVYQATIP